MLNRVKYAMLCMARQCWEQGIAAQAMLECGDSDTMVQLARDCVVRQNADGRLCDVEGTPAIVDPAICVEPVRAAGELLGKEHYLRAAQRNVDYLLHDAPASSDGARYHLLGGEEVWADSLAMGPHVLMQAGYLDEGVRYYEAVRRRLFDESTGLVHHKWDERSQSFSRACYWGVGNGWALVGLMRMAMALKARGDGRWRKIAADFAALVEAMLPHQAENGFFHDILDDLQSFYESESTEMFAYSIYKMVLCKMVDERYLCAADRARRAVEARVDASGLLLSCAGSPDFEHEGTSVEGQAHFIMMEAAAASLNR